MALSDRTILKNAWAGSIGSSGAVSPSTASANASTKYYQFLVGIGSGAAATSAVTETAIHMPVAGKVVGVSMTAPIAVTASDTNYATVSVAKRTGAGSAVPVASKTTKITAGSGNLAAFVPYKFPAAALVATAVELAADDVLTLAIAKASSGVALNADTSYFNVTVAVEEI